MSPRVIDCEQGSPEWFAARRAIPTASGFHKLITAKTLKPSAQADGYLHALLAEWALGETCTMEPSGWMSRGTELEDLAARWYAYDREVDVRKVGFVVRDDGMVGCSPDRVVGSDLRRLLEIKCPSAANHVAHMLDGGRGIADEYRLQLQGELLVCEAESVDIISYNPALPQVVLTVPRDEAVLGPLRIALDAFVARLLAGREAMQRLGCSPAVAAGDVA